MTDRVAQWEQTIREALHAGYAVYGFGDERHEGLVSLAALVAEANALDAQLDRSTELLRREEERSWDAGRERDALRDVETAARVFFSVDGATASRVAEKRLREALARLDAARAERGEAANRGGERMDTWSDVG